MTAIKIEPPAKLPEQGVTEVQFNIWREELEVYLEQDPRFAAFMAGGPYSRWEALEANPDRLSRPAGGDTERDLPARRRQLRTFLSLVAKKVDVLHFNIVTRKSTSLQWIYERLRDDHHIQHRGLALLKAGLYVMKNTFLHGQIKNCLQ
jgi:hypothetical protein